MFKQLQQIKQRFAKFISSNNSMSLPNQYLKYGNKGMASDWSDVIMSDKDLYTGYGYAAIRNRANSVARLAGEHITTTGEKDLIHPYLDIITQSPTFTEYSFWHDISVYLDLEGVYYLLAVRASNGDKLGNIQEFKMLSPYNIRRVMTADTLQVAGYIETKKGLIREIPKEMIIEMRELNPFDEEAPYAMTDAAKESQFTLKTAGDYMRHAMKGNINAPGVLSTDVILPQVDFENFVARVRNHTKGEPIFSNGAGGVTYQSMTSSLKDSALNIVSEINRDQLFAVAGVSKTIMGIEQSGTTRETARVQKDLNMESQIIPRVQLIVDALNQDFINNSPQDKKLLMIINNPLGTDFDAKIKEQDLKDKEFLLYKSLIDKGYDKSVAAQYVKGEIDIDMLGEPKNEPVVVAKVEKVDEVEKVEDKKEQLQVNKLENEEKGIIQQQQASLQNAIVNIEARITGNVIDRVRRKMSKTAIQDISSQGEDLDEKDVITKTEKKEHANELLAVLTIFYGLVMSLQGGQKMRDRTGEMAMGGTFAIDKAVKKYIKLTSEKVATGHVDTIAKDLFELVRKDALEGLPLEDIISNITTKYSGDITENRAKAVARTETNRAFTRSQYEADKQFIEQNKLEGRAFKEWVTRSDNPCPFCSELESRGKIPFDTNFADLGDVISVDGKDLKVGFEALEAGNAHTNCSCEYHLIIEPAKNALTIEYKDIKNLL